MHKLLENINGWVHNGPTGNDKQFVAQAAGVITSLLSAYLASQPSKVKPLSPGKIASYMSPVQGMQNKMMAGYNKMLNIGQDLMDPTSNINQQTYQQLDDQGQNTLALQQLLAKRQGAGDTDSGIQDAIARMTSSQTARNLGTTFSNALTANRATGISTIGQAQSILPQAAHLQQNISENIAQSAISGRQWEMSEEERRRQAMAAAMSGMGSGLMAYTEPVAPITNIYNQQS